MDGQSRGPTAASGLLGGVKALHISFSVWDGQSRGQIAVSGLFRGVKASFVLNIVVLVWGRSIQGSHRGLWQLWRARD